MKTREEKKSKNEKSANGNCILTTLCWARLFLGSCSQECTLLVHFGFFSLYSQSITLTLYIHLPLFFQHICQFLCFSYRAQCAPSHFTIYQFIQTESETHIHTHASIYSNQCVNLYTLAQWWSNLIRENDSSVFFFALVRVRAFIRQKGARIFFNHRTINFYM